MSFPKYPRYKDSGVGWLDEVPEHWECLRTKRLFRLVVEPAPDNNDYELLSLYTDIGVKPRKELEERGNKASTTDGYLRVRKGDIIVNKLLAWMGAIGLSEYDGVTSPAYDILRAVRQLDARFYDYLFRCGVCLPEFKRYSRGIMDMRLRLYFDEFGQLPMPFPPLEEQHSIIAFLDRETAKIDTLIAKQERLIELLQEKRQALISLAVTKGLNPDAPMKDSGIGWLGEIPVHWDRAPLKHIVKIRITDGPHETPEFLDDGVPFLSAEAVKNGKLDFNRKRGFISEVLHKEYAKKCQPKRGDVMMVKSGNTTGAIAIVETDEVFGIWSPLALIRVRPKMMDSRFVYHSLQAEFFQKGVALYCSYGTQPNIGMGVIENLFVTLPPLIEQEKIVDFIDRKTAKLNMLIVKSGQAIEFLKEHRITLISAAVTGKIDVRETASRAEAAAML